MNHTPVLPKKVLEGLQIQPGEIFVDATLGSAGHSLAISEKLGKGGLIIGIDADSKRIEKSKEVLKSGRAEFKLINKNFRGVENILNELEIKEVDKILFDLGLNSEQLESSDKGFSFQKNEPLLMNFGGTSKLTAKEIVNEWSEESLADIIWGYGGEKFARVIAKKIVEVRKEKQIETTTDLVQVIEKAVPNWYKHKQIHPATKTFQALRITVNEELDALKEGLEGGFKKLNSGGRMAVISFHELEDRLTKRYFRDLKNKDLAEILTKKPITPKRSEIKENPRARSAKLRVIQKI